METTAPQIDWSESEWFQTWLELARRDYQGKLDSPNSFPALRQPVGTLVPASGAAPGDEPHQ